MPAGDPMRHAFLVLAGLAPLAACGAPPPPYNVPPSSPVNVAYSCADGQTPVVRYFANNRATIRLSPDRAVELTGQESGSATRFVGEGVVLTTEGREATLEMAGSRTSCRRTPSR